MDRHPEYKHRGGRIILVIVLFCVVGFVWWYMTHEDDPTRQKISDFINDIFNMDSPHAVDAELLKQEGDIQLQGTGYHYEQLSAEAKQAYKFIYQGCTEFASEIRIPSTSSDECNRAIYALRTDHPEFFWIRGNTVSITYINGVAVSVTCTVPSDAEKKMKRIESIADEVLKGAPVDEYGKVKYIYEYIINTTDYDQKGLDDPDNQNIYRTLVDHLAVCGGYANTFLYLCDKAGIYCGYVSGEVKGRGPHAWNFVKFGNKYYWVDVTWGDPVFEGSLYSVDSSSLQNTINYDYLCVTDDEIMPGRILSSSPSYSAYQTYMDFIYPKCTDNSYNYYIREECYFTGYIRMVVYDYILTQVGMIGNRTVMLKFDSMESYRMAKADILDSDDFLNQLAKDLKKSYGIEITQQFARMSDDAYRLEIEFS